MTRLEKQQGLLYGAEHTKKDRRALVCFSRRTSPSNTLRRSLPALRASLNRFLPCRACSYAHPLSRRPPHLESWECVSGFLKAYQQVVTDRVETLVGETSKLYAAPGDRKIREVAMNSGMKRAFEVKH